MQGCGHARMQHEHCRKHLDVAVGRIKRCAVHKAVQDAVSPSDSLWTNQDKPHEKRLQAQAGILVTGDFYGLLAGKARFVKAV
jgi:hypothetical protein